MARHFFCATFRHILLFSTKNNENNEEFENYGFCRPCVHLVLG